MCFYGIRASIERPSQTLEGLCAQWLRKSNELIHSQIPIFASHLRVHCNRSYPTLPRILLSSFSCSALLSPLTLPLLHTQRESPALLLLSCRDRMITVCCVCWLCAAVAALLLLCFLTLCWLMRREMITLPENLSHVEAT